MYAKSTRPSAKREVQKERSAKRDVQKFWSAQRDYRVLRSAKRAAREARDENVPAKGANFFQCITPKKKPIFGLHLRLFFL